MTIGVLQAQAVDNNGLSQTTIAVSLTGVAAGSSFHVFVLTNHNYVPLSGVADNVNGALTQRGTAADDATGSRNVSQWTIDGLTAGAHTVTVTFLAAFNQVGTLVVLEIGATSGFSVTANGNTQVAPGTGANAISSSAATNSGTALISSLTLANSGTIPAAGTGYTAGLTGTPVSLAAAFCCESARVTTNQSNLATYTTTAGANRFLTAMAIFNEVAANYANLERSHRGQFRGSL